MFDWLRRLFKRKPKATAGTKHGNERLIATSSSVTAVEEYKHKIQVDRKAREERIRELDRQIEEHEQRIKELRTRPVKPFSYVPSKPRQPVSQTYTQPRRKIRGMKPRSARNKRMWKLHVSEEELEKEEGD